MQLPLTPALSEQVAKILGHRIKEFSVSIRKIGPDNTFGRAVRASYPSEILDLTKGDNEIVLVTSIDGAPLLTVDTRKVTVKGVTPLKRNDESPIQSFRLPFLRSVTLRPTKDAQLTDPNVKGYRLTRRSL